MTKSLENDYLKLILGIGEGQNDVIPIVADLLEDSNVVYPETLPVLPLRNTVLFPGVVIPLTVGRSRSYQLIKRSLH
jgi:ATP-dependent Lon protease